MRKNIPIKHIDKRITRKEMSKIMSDHYEKPDTICDCGYHKNACVCEMQKLFEKQEEDKKKDVKQETEVKN